MTLRMIDQSASGSTVQVAVGDEIQLVLPETRTAGYKWQVVSADSPVFALRDDGSQIPGAIGGTGSHRWTITAVEKGSAALELAYGRSWETDAGKRFEVTIVVS